MARLEVPRGPRRRHHFLRDAILALVFAATAASCASHRDVAGGGAGQTFRDDAVRVSREYHFADLNGEQLESARRFGISRPIKNRKEARRKTRHLKKVRSCQLYLVDPLTHSVPYLTKGARSLLEDLGEGFQYILRREGYRPHRIIVTSLLRTEADVTSLRRVCRGKAGLCHRDGATGHVGLKSCRVAVASLHHCVALVYSLRLHHAGRLWRGVRVCRDGLRTVVALAALPA